MNKCSNSLIDKQQEVLNILKLLKYNADGCKSFGNILKNVKIGLMTTWNLNGTEWISIKCKIKLRKWELDYNPLKLTIENAILLLVSVNKLKDGVFLFPWLLILSINLWVLLIIDIGKKFVILLNRTSKLMIHYNSNSYGT